ncbi:MAG: hypothetical protein KJZ90_03340 [Rhodocyclaceae bacterium]|nr:hypothetical protein [Rhodocyclaceae bacterium]
MIGYDTSGQSSSIATIGWDKAFGMVVTFRMNDHYHYPDAPEEAFKRIMAKEVENSYGKTYHAVCKELGLHGIKITSGYRYAVIKPASEYAGGAGKSSQGNPGLQPVLDAWQPAKALDCSYAW